MKIQYFTLRSVVLLLLSLLAVAEIQGRDRVRKSIIYFTQGYWGPIFDPEARQARKNEGYELEPMLRLKAKAAELGYDLRTVKFENCRIFEMDGSRLKPFLGIVVFDCFRDQLRPLKKIPGNKKNLILWEPPAAHSGNYDPRIHHLYSKVYTWRDDLVDDQQYFKLFHPVLAEDNGKGLPFGQKKLAVIIATSKFSGHPDEQYSERRKVIEFYESKKSGDFALYGRYWDKNLSCYQGEAEDKKETLSHFKFCYCFENMRNIEGYVTEKIFNCFEAGCVPIYWGASNILDFVPAGCFIDRRDFEDDEDLYQYISTMDEETYSVYLKTIDEFLKSDSAHLFSYDYFVEAMLELVKGFEKR